MVAFAQDRILAALDAVPRSAFLASDDLDAHLCGHSIPSRSTLKNLLSLLPELSPDSNVLHVGHGAGYVAAVLSRLVKRVVAIDRDEGTWRRAAGPIDALSLSGVELRHADSSELAGWDERFDLVLVTSFLEDLSPLKQVLRPQGSLVALEPVPQSPPALIHYQCRQGELVRLGMLGKLDFRRSTEEVLIDLGFVPDDEPPADGKKPEAAIRRALKRNSVSEQELYRQLAAARRGLTLVELSAVLRDIAPSLFARFSKTFLEHHRLIPVYQRDGRLYVVSDNPDASIDVLARLTELPVELLLVTPTDFRRLWSHLSISERGNERSGVAPRLPEADDGEGLALDREGQVSPFLVSLYEAILLEAVSQEASDVHLERYGSRVRIRLRVDGDLRDLDHIAISAAQLPGVINVIKLRAELNIAERRLPQGGRSRLKFGDLAYDLRVQTQPSLHGEHVVIRLLRQTGRAMTMSELGMSPKLARRYQRLLDNPAGLVLVVGPTGSGKSTTLYAGLQELADEGHRKVITVEDPIEYSIDNVQQTAVKPDIGFNFADAMRAFVREDPDVILVGEIRDSETALEAIRASQTGHVVLSTLHCNDSVDALQRLFDLGIHPNSIASELLAVIAQRLAKRICKACRQPAEPDPDIMAELFPDGAPPGFRCFEGQGCNHCHGRGTRGRVAVVEFLQTNSDIRDAISRHLPVGELRALALDAGLNTMRDSALEHVVQGTIPLSELPRLLPEDRMAPEKRGGRV